MKTGTGTALIRHSGPFDPSSGKTFTMSPAGGVNGDSDKDKKKPGWVGQPIRLRDPTGWKQLRDPAYHKKLDEEAAAKEKFLKAVETGQLTTASVTDTNPVTDNQVSEQNNEQEGGTSQKRFSIKIRPREHENSEDVKGLGDQQLKDKVDEKDGEQEESTDNSREATRSLVTSTLEATSFSSFASSSSTSTVTRTNGTFESDKEGEGSDNEMNAESGNDTSGSGREITRPTTGATTAATNVMTKELPRRRVRSVYKCDSCGRRFFSEEWLREHLCMTHSKNVKKGKNLASVGKNFQCDYCDASFPTAKALSAHQLKHKVATHECDICHVMFKERHHLTRHRVKHFKTAICERCGKRLGSLADVLAHQRNSKACKELFNLTKVESDCSSTATEVMDVNDIF